MGGKREIITRRYIVRGGVQGVGYRSFAVRHANLLGLHGWARNLSDGSVEVVAQGRAADVAEFAGYLRQGPRFSDVRGVEEMEASLIQSRGFSIDY
jgi:acylphosphatase